MALVKRKDGRIEQLLVVAGTHAYRPRKPAATSFLMSRIRAVDTRMEVLLRTTLHRRGYRFRKNVGAIKGKPDIVFAREKVAVFVDGDYWHARILKEAGLEQLRNGLKTCNRDFWVAKLQRNHERDLVVTDELERAGRLVIRLWESDLKRNIDVGVRAVEAGLQARRRVLAHKSS
jgi:DNA mismatch endonuclease, patch repair protein